MLYLTDKEAERLNATVLTVMTTTSKATSRVIRLDLNRNPDERSRLLNLIEEAELGLRSLIELQTFLSMVDEGKYDADRNAADKAVGSITLDLVSKLNEGYSLSAHAKPEVGRLRKRVVLHCPESSDYEESKLYLEVEVNDSGNINPDCLGCGRLSEEGKGTAFKTKWVADSLRLDWEDPKFRPSVLRGLLDRSVLQVGDVAERVDGDALSSVYEYTVIAIDDLKPGEMP